MNHEPPQVSTENTPKVEEKLERLTHEASRLINAASREEREELRAYAISLLQEETEMRQVERTSGGDITRQALFNPFALALPLAVAGGILFFPFPGVGLILFLAAASAGVWGILRPLLFR